MTVNNGLRLDVGLSVGAVGCMSVFARWWEGDTRVRYRDAAECVCPRMSLGRLECNFSEKLTDGAGCGVKHLLYTRRCARSGKIGMCGVYLPVEMGTD